MARSIARLMVILAAVLGTSVAIAGQRTFDRRLEAPPGGRLTFTSDVGSITVIGHDAPEVVMHVQLRGSTSFLDHFHIDAQQTATGVTISAQSHHGGSFGWLDWFDFGSHRARFTLEVPRAYPIDLRTSGGDIVVRDLDASVRAVTSGGEIRLRNVTGTVNVHTSGGPIDAKRLQGPAKLSTSGGRIEVADSTGDLEARTSGGGIQLRNDDGKIDARTSGGGIRARLLANRGITLATSGGSIRVRLPQDIHASIDARTSGGGITSEFPVTTSEFGSGSRLVGTVGGGGPLITLRTSGGSIDLAPSH
jgi:hypothetical protein